MIVSKEYKRFLIKAKYALRDAYSESIASDNKAESTVEKCIEEVGFAATVDVVAAMILAKGKWDERISSRSRQWAESVCYYTAEDLKESGIYYCDSIHPAHMDQIAFVVRNL